MTRSLTFAAGLAVVGVALYLNRGALEQVWTRGADWGDLACGTVLLLFELAVASFRWRTVLQSAGVSLAYLDTVRLVVFARASQLFLPLPSGNDLALLGLVASTVPDRTAAMGSVLIDRLIGVTGLFTVAALMGTLNRVVLREPNLLLGRLHLLAIAFAVGLWILLGILLRSSVRDAAIRLVPTERAKRIALELSRGLQGLAARPSVFLTTMGLSLVTHLLAISAFFFACRALRLVQGEGGWLQLFVVVPFILITTVLPIPVGAMVATLSVSDQLFRLMGIEGGALAFLSYNAIVILAVYVALPFVLRRAR